MSRVDTHTVLKLLAAEFERSKQEQIDRFLRDQEELNKRFNEFSVHGDNDKDDEGDSDTESIFTQRMSVYKSRPQTSMGWTELERERDFGFDQDSEGSANFNVSEPDADQWKSAVATAAKVVTAVDIGTEQANQTASRNADVGGESKNRFATRHKASQDANARQQHRGQQAAQPQGAHIPPGQRLVGLDNRILLTRRSSRPRTATGVQSSRGNVYKNQVRVDKEQDLEDPGARAGRPMRASAPATVSRVRRISWEPDSKKGSFLPDGRQTTGLLQNVSSPSYAVGRPKASQQTAAASPIMSARNGGGAPRNSSNKELNANSFMIISSMNPQVRGSKESLTVEQRYTVEHGGKLPLEYASNKQEAQTRDVLLLRDVTAHLGELHPNKMDQNRTNSRRSVLKLPPLDAPGGAGGRGSPANQGYNNAKIQKPTPTSERNKQNEHGFLVG